ncbi:MAG: type II toxin-antitoxin system RelE/ParE family toxin [Verrucomicrobia bacterium]|nr:type II toxin-antitoxin system RelE/ParE family toxin [Verrucomicrobiota bacterium]
MAFDYIVRQKAENDLDEIIDYIASDNPGAALNLYETFLKQFEYLSLFPEVGRLRKEFSPVVRSSPVGNYVIFFRESSPVEIIRVIHGAQDITEHYLD